MKKSSLFLGMSLVVGAPAYGDELSTVTDSLKMSTNVELEEVVVTATKAGRTTPMAFSNISKEVLNSRNDGQGIPTLLATSPSVVVTADDGLGIGYSGIRIRGTDANRINVTVNGVPVNDSESHGVFWVNMPDFASSVENIQIQRGAGTSTNGAAAFGATVALQTQAPHLKPSAEYSLSGGSFGTMRHTLKGGTGLLNNGFSVDARYSNVRSDGFIDRARTQMSSYDVSAAWHAENTLIRFQTFGSNEQTYQAWNGIPSALLKEDYNKYRTYNSCGEYTDENGATRYYDNQIDNYKQQHYHLTGSQRIGNQWSMNLTLHYTHGEGYYEEYKAESAFTSYKLHSFYAPSGDTLKHITAADLVRRKWLDNDFYGGVYSVNYRAERLQLTAGTAVNNYVGDHFGRVMWVKTANVLPEPNYQYYLNTGKKLDYSAYVKANSQFLSYLNGYLDLQYRGIDYSIKGSDDVAGEHVDIKKSWNFFNPKVGINYIRQGHTAFASFSVANREPNRDNFTEAAQTEHPTYETLHDYEAGYRFQNTFFHLGANVYYMDYNNQLILSGKLSEIGEALTTNIKDSYRTGIELTGGVSLTSWLNWGGNLTLSSNKIKNFTEYVDMYDKDWDFIGQEAIALGTTDIAYSPNLIANSIFDFAWKGFSATLTSQYVGRQHLDNTSNRDRTIDPYFVNNLRLGYAFKPRFVSKIGIDFTVNNLLNERYETNGWVYSSILDGVRGKDEGYYTQAGTNLMCRLSIVL
ncbi:TonB-dependent receptor [Bacteroidia bacterium]|nr:TonB-dependent receptor [Bacteroidia bacterium]